MFPRRVIAHRSTIALLLRNSLQCRCLSHISSPNPHPFIRPSYVPFSLLPFTDFISQDFRRSFAKGRKSKANEEADTVQITEDIGPAVKSATVSQMELSIDALSRELRMLDHIIVETGGVKMPLNRLAVVSVIDAKTLSVTPYDPDSLKELEKAIVSSPLGLNPKTDGQRLIAAIPPLTKEHVQAMCKVVSRSSEDVKLSIRRARQKALDMIKKAGTSYPKDSAKKLEKEVDELTKKFVKSAEDICKSKEKELFEG